eukprot:4349048-Pleurochrysis_carterae.AAC.1
MPPRRPCVRTPGPRRRAPPAHRAPAWTAAESPARPPDTPWRWRVCALPTGRKARRRRRPGLARP